MSKQETIRQHYVPRTYLKHFSEKRSGGYFIKALPVANFEESKIYETSINGICLQKNLYTLSGETAEDRMLLENFYSENYEQHYNRVYELLIDPSKRKLKKKERDLIISTVVTMFYRTTKMMNQHNDFFDRILEDAFNTCKQTGKDYFYFDKVKVSITGKTLKQLQEECRSEGRPAQVLMQLRAALRLKEIRSAKDGIFISKLLNDDDEYVTSDHPVVLSNGNGKHIAPFDPSNTMSFPIDNKHKVTLMPYSDEATKHLIVRHDTKGIVCFTGKLIANYQQSRNAERFMLGTETGLKSYLKTKELSEKPLPQEEAITINSYDDFLRKCKELGLY